MYECIFHSISLVINELKMIAQYFKGVDVWPVDTVTCKQDQSTTLSKFLNSSLVAHLLALFCVIDYFAL